MAMILGKAFERFARLSSVTVMLRGVLEHALPRNRFDELFREHAVSQRKDRLLLSSVANVLSLVVTGMRKSVNSAYEATAEQIVDPLAVRQIAEDRAASLASPRRTLSGDILHAGQGSSAY